MIARGTDEILISGLMHLACCHRQWALIHLEGQWNENFLTAQGRQFHQRVHSTQTELRNGILTVRGLALSCRRLGLYGVADVVEFSPEPNGTRLTGRQGTWRPFPVEYKRGKGTLNSGDRIQLCAQALCLEEMLEVPVTQGALFYGEPRRRTVVDLDQSLRVQVEKLCDLARDLMVRGTLPPAVKSHFCRGCSLNELCVPQVSPRARAYIDRNLEASLHEAP